MALSTSDISRRSPGHDGAHHFTKILQKDSIQQQAGLVILQTAELPPDYRHHAELVVRRRNSGRKRKLTDKFFPARLILELFAQEIQPTLLHGEKV